MIRNMKEHHWIWIGSGIAVIALIVVAVIMFDYPSDDEEASQKADELATALELAGIYVPDHDMLMGWFGNDGGAVCQGASDLTLAQLNQQISNGAAQAGVRPVLIAENTLRGEAIVISIYCPEHLDEFQDYVEDLEFEDVTHDD